MFWLTIIRDFIKILREGQTPAQVAGGFALGSIVGLSSSVTLQGLLVWLVIFAINVNLAAAFLAFTLFSLVAWLLDPLFHLLGYALLVDVGALRDTWTALYNAPVAPLTRFNNTVILGSFVASIVLAFPVYFGMKRLVIAYRKHIGSKVEKLKMYQIFKRSALVRWYERIRDLGGR
jgi:uncharacterized protein (TIGR03546 family)